MPSWSPRTSGPTRWSPGRGFRSSTPRSSASAAGSGRSCCRLPAHRRRADRLDPGAEHLDHPWQTYEYLTRVSQIPRGERIRSDSASRPDNIWGFPSLRARARRCADKIAAARSCRCSSSRSSPTTGPRGRDRCSRAWRRETHRISATRTCWSRAMVRMVRRRRRRRLLHRSSPRRRAPAAPSASPTGASYVHLAVGYPGLQFLPDLQEFREQLPATTSSVVNAYEPHEHVYEAPADAGRAPCWCAAAGSSPPGSCSG